MVIERPAGDEVEPTAPASPANGAALPRLAGQRSTRSAKRHRVSLVVRAVARLSWLLFLSLLVAPALLVRNSSDRRPDLTSCAGTSRPAAAAT